MKSCYHKFQAHLTHLSHDIPLNQHIPKYRGGGGMNPYTAPKNNITFMTGCGGTAGRLSALSSLPFSILCAACPTPEISSFRSRSDSRNNFIDRLRRFDSVRGRWSDICKITLTLVGHKIS